MPEVGPKLLRGLLELFVLERLEREPRHGYALLREAAQTFGASPNRNRLYPLLGRLVRDGLVAETGDGGEGRTLYALTELGHRELAAYRDLPPAFRETLARVWGGGGEGEGEGEGAGAEAPGPAPAPAPGLGIARAIPVRAGAPLPYPCPDARVVLERRPAGGELVVRVTGCPIGTFSYCPQCPMSKGLAALGALATGSGA